MNKTEIVKHPQFLNLSKTLKLYDKDVVEMKSVVFDGNTSATTWFEFLDKEIQRNIKKPISRSAYGNIRDPFEAKPEIQIAVDEAVEYGNKVDDNIEAFVNGKLQEAEILPETLMTVDNLVDNGLVWAGRSLKICHPKGFSYGEIDELLYNPKTETFHIADTKTSSKIDKIGYYYQLASYVQILRELNPDKNISDIVYINWVKIKEDKWVMDKNWEVKYKAVHGELPTGKVDKEHPIYNAYFTGKQKLPVPKVNKELRAIDLRQDFGICPNVIYKLVSNDWHLMHSLLPKIGLKGAADSIVDIHLFPELDNYNKIQQQVYNLVKEKIEGR